MDGMERMGSETDGQGPVIERALGEQRTARRLLACAAAAILLGALSVFAAPPTAPLADAQPRAGSAGQADTRASADIKPKLTDDFASAEELVVPPEAPLAPHETKTPSGLDVVAFFPDAPMTVRERARLRTDASQDASVVESLEPGRPLRVVGAVDVPRGQGGPWLQVRLGDGGLAYVQAGLAADMAGWRRQQIAEQPRRHEQEAAAAAAASGIDVQPGALPPDLLEGAPISAPFPDTQPFRPN